MYSLKIATEPTEEPITLAEAKEHIRISSDSFDDTIDENQSIVPGSQSVVASYGLQGTGVDVLSYDTVVILNSGTNGTGGTVDCKIQESDDDSTYSDWSGSAFTQVTTSNDNAIQEIYYSGNKQYIRTVATVAGSVCSFGTTIIRRSINTVEDDYITNLIKTSRKHYENVTGRALITQTWDMYVDDWPDMPLEIPLPPLQSISYIWYTDTDLDVSTVGTTVYRTDAKSHPGRINFAYGQTWPIVTLDTVNGINIRFVCGYGTAGNVAEDIKQDLLMMVGHLYENREMDQKYVLNTLTDELLTSHKVWEFI